MINNKYEKIKFIINYNKNIKVVYIPNKRYITGYNFQNRVKRLGEKLGYYVFTNPKSSFPDQVWLHPKDTPRFIECKVKSSLEKKKTIHLKDLISNEEIGRAIELLNKGFYFSVAFRIKPRGQIYFYEMSLKDSGHIIDEEKIRRDLNATFRDGMRKKTED